MAAAARLAAAVMSRGQAAGGDVADVGELGGELERRLPQRGKARVRQVLDIAEVTVLRARPPAEAVVDPRVGIAVELVHALLESRRVDAALLGQLHRREEWRKLSHVSTVADGVIMGCGIQGYVLGVERVATISRLTQQEIRGGKPE